MAKTLQQRIAQLEKLVADFFTGATPMTKSARKPARRKAKKAAKKSTKKTAKKTTRRKSPRRG